MAGLRMTSLRRVANEPRFRRIGYEMNDRPRGCAPRSLPLLVQFTSPAVGRGRKKAIGSYDRLFSGEGWCGPERAPCVGPPRALELHAMPHRPRIDPTSVERMPERVT